MRANRQSDFSSSRVARHESAPAPPNGVKSVIIEWPFRGRQRPKKRHSTEEIIGKLRGVEVLVGRGSSLGEAARSIGVTDQTYYRWRQEYGGLKMG